MDSENEAALLVLMERTGYPMLQVRPPTTLRTVTLQGRTGRPNLH